MRHFSSGFSAIPRRTIPSAPGLVVSPADGKITSIETIHTPEGARTRISIFLNVFNVHVNRSPVRGVVREVRYQKGLFVNAMDAASADRNEQNICIMEAEDGYQVVFKQIAGLLANGASSSVTRRATALERGQRVGLIKFGSRTDILLPADAEIRTTLGAHVSGGSTVLALRCAPRRHTGDAELSEQPSLLPAEPWRETVPEREPGLDAASDESTQRNKPRRRKPRGMFLLPSVFTAGNIAAGYFAITQSLQGSALEPQHFDYAALAIGFAIPFDALDGRIARMTNTTSEFGKELDSLADVITFGVAPSLLAYTWGFHALPFSLEHSLRHKLVELGALLCFLFLLCGAARLARFNSTGSPVPKNPGRPGRKYFVGMPIPAAAGANCCRSAFFRRHSGRRALGRPCVGRLCGLHRLSHGQHLALLERQGRLTSRAPIRFG